MATVELGGVTREVSLMLLPEAKPDDFVLIHAGFAIRTLTVQEAEENLSLMRRMAEVLEAQGRLPGAPE